MRTRTVLKMLLAILIVASFPISAISATKEQVVDWGDKEYRIIVPGFIEGRDIVIDGTTVHAIVIEKPEPKSNGMYSFFEIVTTDPKVAMVTSSVGNMDEQLGDFMSAVENDGRVTFTPTLYDDFEVISQNPLYLGFSFRNGDFEEIYEFPLWVIFEGEAASVPTPEPKVEPTPVQEPVTASESVEVKEVTAVPTSAKVIVDGKQVAFEAYTINDFNYFKLRDLAMAVTGSEKQFEVTWDDAKRAINLVSGDSYTPAGNELTVGTGISAVKGTTNQSKIYVNGEETAFEAYTINGNNYFKLRDIAAAFDFNVAWDGTLNQIAVNTNEEYTE